MTYITNKMMGYLGKPLGAEIAGIAEYAVMDADRVWLKPDNFSFEEASTVSISFDTALGAVRKADIKSGQNIIVYGASGGVGLYAVQLAKEAGAIVTGVCSKKISQKQTRNMMQLCTVKMIAVMIRCFFGDILIAKQDTADRIF